MNRDAMLLTLDDVDDIARGAGVLGCGGGGDPYIGALMCKQAMRQGQPVRLMALEQLPDDALVAVILGIGAPPVLVEKVANGGESELALRHLERRLGRRVDVLMAAEIGGLNSLYPLTLAAKLGLPVVDADGMGRAFPKLEMTSFHIGGIRSTPLSLVNSQGDSVLVETGHEMQVEVLIGQLCMGMGGFMSAAGFAQSGAEARRVAVPGTVSICRTIGRTMNEARERRVDVFSSLLDALRATDYYRHATALFEGKVADVVRRIDGRFSVGTVRLENGADTMLLTVQNEFLAAHQGGRTRAIVPDLITLLDHETCEPITAESVRYGQRVRVMASSVPPIMRSPEALAVWGPQAFGIDEPFVPLEER